MRPASIRILASWMLLAFLCACEFRYGGWGGGGSPTPRTPEPPPDAPSEPRSRLGPDVTPPEGCAPALSAWHAAQVLYASTEASVHELVTCAGIQVRIAQSVLAILLASNRSLFEDVDYDRLLVEARRLGLDLSLPLDPVGAGRWRMPLSGRPESSFDLSFFRPSSVCPPVMHSDDPRCGPIEEDLFDLESYLEGLIVTSSLSLSEMFSNPSLRTRLTFDWEALGPLSDMLNHGDPFPDPFVVTISLHDVATLALGGMIPESSGADFGPLASLIDAGMQSCVEILDRRGPIEVAYHVDARRETVAAIASSGGIAFDVDRITADDGALLLEGSTANLSFVRVGALAGSLEYSVWGPEVSLMARSDFGSGQAYPSTSWRCAP